MLSRPTTRERLPQRQHPQATMLASASAARESHGPETTREPCALLIRQQSPH